MTSRITLTGVQPTGDLHLGNYIGAIRPLADLAVDLTRDVYVFVADLHALNSRPDPAVLRERSRRLVAALLACGLDRPNVHVYRQSRIPAVAAMAALLNNITAKGLQNRAQAYKAAVAANVAAGRDPDHDALRAFAEPATVAAVEQRYRSGGIGYGEVKALLADAIGAHVAPMRDRYQRLLDDPAAMGL